MGRILGFRDLWGFDSGFRGVSGVRGRRLSLCRESFGLWLGGF